MSGVAKRTPDFAASKNNTRANKNEYKILMMQLMRRMKRATTKKDIEYHLNVMHLILQMNTFDFNIPKQRLKYIEVKDVAPTNQDCKEDDDVCILLLGPETVPKIHKKNVLEPKVACCVVLFVCFIGMSTA